MQKQFPKSEILIINQHLATDGNVQSLLGKLAVILKASSHLIEKSEIEYPKKTINVLIAESKELLLESNHSITEKALVVSTLNLTQLTSKNNLTNSYLGILGNLADIHHSTNTVVKAPGWNGPLGDGVNSFEDLLSNIQFSGFLNSKRFLDHVVPLFFIANLHCYQLNRYLEKANGYTIESHVARYRAHAAANAGIHGQEQLKLEISEFLSKLDAGVKYTNITDLFNKTHGELGKILEEYKDRLGSPTVKGGKNLTYGNKLTEEGLKRKLYQWAREEEFNKVLLRIIEN